MCPGQDDERGRVEPLDPRILDLLGEFPRELFDERFYVSWELVHRYGQQWALRLARDLGLEPELAEPRTADELIARHGFVPAARPAVVGLLRQLVAQGVVSADAAAGGPAHYVLNGPLPATDLAAVRATCLAVDARNAPSLDLLDLAGGAWPAVAAGRTRGQEALFGLGQSRLWLAYFANDNPSYAINNRLAAIAAVHRLPPGRLRILELGGGGGSGSEALLTELARVGRLADVESYAFTEPSPFLRRGAERRLRAAHPALALTVAGLDVDLPLAEQGVAPGSTDLVYAVNVLHVAHDLAATLAALRDALAPGGVLIAAEAMRNHAREPLPTELPFLLLESYWNVVLDAELRPVPGFLSPVQWRRLLGEAGFTGVEVVPDHERIRGIYPRFSTGVLCGRRP